LRGRRIIQDYFANGDNTPIAGKEQQAGDDLSALTHQTQPDVLPGRQHQFALSKTPGANREPLYCVE
jgi:hypothetical protein